MNLTTNLDQCNRKNLQYETTITKLQQEIREKEIEMQKMRNQIQNLQQEIQRKENKIELCRK